MSSKHMAIINDNRIYDLAEYTISDGMTKCVKDMSLIHSKFIEYKKLVIKGEFKTIDELEESVCSRYGIMDEVKETPMEALKEIDNEFKRRDLNGKQHKTDS